MSRNWIDWFSLRRRQVPRVAIQCIIDVEIPNSEPLHYTGLNALDISAQGLRLEGADDAQIRDLICDRGRAWMRLRLPGTHIYSPRVHAELRWGMGEKPKYQTGWRFTEINSSTVRVVEDYIEANLGDIVEEPEN